MKIQILLDLINKRPFEGVYAAKQIGQESKLVGDFQEENVSVRIVIDYNFIWANGVPIISCYNDWRTAKSVFENCVDMFIGPSIWNPSN